MSFDVPGSFRLLEDASYGRFTFTLTTPKDEIAPKIVSRQGCLDDRTVTFWHPAH